MERQAQTDVRYRTQKSRKKQTYRKTDTDRQTYRIQKSRKKQTKADTQIQTQTYRILKDREEQTYTETDTEAEREKERPSSFPVTDVREES